jgi:hypothetical protein
MDRNGDGDLSPGEFLGKSEVFKEMDADGDGLVSLSEALAYEAKHAPAATRVGEKRP